MSRRARKLPDSVGCPCAVCGDPIPRPKKNGRPRRYCSDVCTQASRSNRAKQRMCAYCGNLTTNTTGFCSSKCHSESVSNACESPAEIERRYQAALAVEKHKRRTGQYADQLERMAVSRTSDPCVDFANITRGDDTDDDLSDKPEPISADANPFKEAA